MYQRSNLRLAPLSTCALTLITLSACDSVDVGRPDEPKGGPVLLRIMVQDEDAFSGRHIATDLLNRAPMRICSEIHPCAAGQPACVIPEGATDGTCPDPLNPSQTPPAIGLLLPYLTGGNQIRLVFDQLLDPDIDVALGEPGSRIVQLLGPNGEIETARYFDPTGSPTQTSDVIISPFGPAIVMKNVAPLSAATAYTIRITPEQIKDRDGEAASLDINGTIRSTYEFTTEGLYTLVLTPDFVAEEGPVIAPDDHFVIETNAHVSEETSASPGVIEVRDGAGNLVAARAFTDCEGGARILHVVRTSSTGSPIPWDEGEYAITTAIVGDNGFAPLTYDLSGRPLEGTFEVSAEETATNSIEGLILPEDCES